MTPDGQTGWRHGLRRCRPAARQTLATVAKKQKARRKGRAQAGASGGQLRSLPPLLSPLGTMGAAIMMQGTPKNKRVLFDIGVAGPLAGMVVAIPVLLLGLSLSHLDVIRGGPGVFQEGNSLLYMLAKYITFGKLLPMPSTLPAGTTAFGYWLRYFFTGQPSPVGAVDVFIHPVAFAGWAGLLVTSLNLIPVGQLDGGHVLYALFGRRGALVVARLVSAGLLLAGVFLSWNWLIWWFLSRFVVGLGHPPALEEEPLDGARRAVAWTSLALFVATFVPVPVSF